MIRRIAPALLALAGSLPTGTTASAGEEADTVSILCRASRGRVALSLFVDTRKREVSVRDERTGRWEIANSPWLGLYDDEFQVKQVTSRRPNQPYVFVDRKTGAFRYSRVSEYRARNSRPIGTCETTAFASPPAAAPTPPGRPNKF